MSRSRFSFAHDASGSFGGFRAGDPIKWGVRSGTFIAQDGALADVKLNGARCTVPLREITKDGP